MTVDDRFGHSVANLGDLYRNDGTVVAVGAPGDDTGGTNRGAIYLLSYDTTGTLTRTVKVTGDTADGPALENGDQFGAAIANLGAFDSGGGTVIAVGAPEDDTGGTNRGAIYLLYYDTAGTLTRTVKVTGDTADGPALENGDQFGAAIANLGDLDGGGGTVVAVGAPEDDTGGTDRGAIHLLSYDAAGTLVAIKINHGTTTPDSSVLTLTDDDSFGRSVAHLGDLYGNDRTVVAVGADGDDTGGNDSGAIHLLSYDATGALMAIDTVTGDMVLDPAPSGDERLGFSIANVGDIDGGNGTVVAVGAIGDRAAGDSNGAVYLLSYNATGTVTATTKIGPDGIPNSPLVNAHDLFGSAIAPLGDFYSDGGTVVAVGAGRTVGSGSDLGTLHLLDYRERLDRFACRNGTPELGAPAASNEERCASCDSGYALNGVRCETTKYACENGTAAPITMPLAASEERCASCDSGYGLNGVRCETARYICQNGIAAVATATLAANEEKCTGCDRGYVLDGIRCAAVKYTCQNGIAAVAILPLLASEEKCARCDSGYALNGVRCETARYTCRNGIAAVATATLTANEEKCARCHPGYGLNGVRCEAGSYYCENGTPRSGRPPGGGRVHACVLCDGPIYYSWRPVPHRWS